MLCGDNLKVFEKTDPTDGTYFRNFAKQVSTLTDWMQVHGDDNVATRLQSVDEVFCGSKNMNDPTCANQQGWDEFLNSATSVLGSWGWKAESKQEKWDAMANIFSTFDAGTGTSEWQQSVAEWKVQFPYHSFVSKQAGLPSASSPSSRVERCACQC